MATILHHITKNLMAGDMLVTMVTQGIMGTIQDAQFLPRSIEASCPLVTPSDELFPLPLDRFRKAMTSFAVQGE